MCGINGNIGRFEEGLIEKMNDSISHRGPNGSAVYIDKNKNVAFGHVRLSVIDLSSASDQPMKSKCNNYVIIFNGEIYNYRKLKKHLISKGYEFRSEGDCEVLLNLWIEYDAEALNMLDGIFSFAIFDTKKNKLTLVRDHFGIKPLYYSLNQNEVIFSSEIKGILQSSNVSREIDFTSASSYLNYLWSPGEHTILKSIKKVKPGFYLEFINGSLISENEFYRLPNYKPKFSLKEATFATRESLRRSVHDQLISDIPVGSFLSGGLDSSLICAFAKEKSEAFTDVFTIDVGKNGEGFEDDLPYAKKVANHLNLNLNIVKSSSDDVQDLPECIFHLDEPQADPAIINTFKICKLAKEKNIRVLFSGAGGDDLFTGYRRHMLAFYQNKIDSIPRIFKFLISAISRVIPTNLAFGRRLRKVVKLFNKPSENSVLGYFSWIETERLLKIFDNDIKELIDIKRTQNIIKDKITCEKGNLVEKTLAVEKSFFLVDHNFNYTDKMSMAHGVEVRVPFINENMVETASKIYTKDKISKTTTKSILKKSAEGFLSNEVIYRKKTGFGAPIRKWLAGPLKPLLDSLLSEESIKKRGMFEFKEVRKLIEDNEKGRGDFAYTIYGLLSLEIWMRQFIDHEKPKKLNMQQLIKNNIVRKIN
tara:strand:+ start:13644 stop:15584 length:1941 start_codon:yes stop_codon:yes gene_type:complete